MVKSAVISGGAFASFPGPSYSQLQCSTLIHIIENIREPRTRLGGLHSLIIPGNKAVSTAREGLYKVIIDLLGLHNCTLMGHCSCHTHLSSTISFNENLVCSCSIAWDEFTVTVRSHVN